MGEPVANPLVSEILRGFEVDTTIDPRDEMLLHVARDHDFDFARTSYFQRGVEAASVHRQLIDHFFRGRRDVDVLDFAAGFGRVTRFFVAEHGASRIWATDIQHDAVGFQRRQFGVDAFVSSNDPAEFNPGRKFDVIVAHSFFSHVPPARFAGWLRTLNVLLREEAILVFSVHDESLLEGRAPDASGITFDATSESDRLATSDYGTTWVSERYVRDIVARTCPGKSVSRFPRGLASFQDLYVVHDHPESFDIDQGPFGFASIARLAGDEFHVIGWASHRNPSRSVREVIAALNGRVVARTESFFERTDVVDLTGDARHLRSGWHLAFDSAAPVSRVTDVLTIKAVSDRGFETILYVGTIAGLLLQSARDELRDAGRETVVFPDKKELERQLATLEPGSPRA